MKNKFYSLFISIVLFAFAKSSAQFANTSLSNLVSPSKVNINLIPDKDRKRNLGSLNKAWMNLYLDSAVYFNGSRFLTAQPGTGEFNTAVGLGALNVNTTGFANTAIGHQTLYNNSTGLQNLAIGDGALYHNNSGFQNIALGIEALYDNTGGARNIAIGGASLFANAANGNVAIGYNSLTSNTSGYSNVALGIGSLYHNVSGRNIVAIGDSALFKQSSTGDDGQSNTAVGSKALYSNTTGFDNVAIGEEALLSNTSAEWNTAVGALALWSNTTGNINTAVGHGALLNNTTGSENTAIGMQALVDNTKGFYNTATGEETLRFNTTGQSNTATGWQALGSGTTASYNTANGFVAGNNVKDGSYNTFLGFSANCGSGGHLTNGMALGNGATVTSNNHIVIGNSSVTSIGGFSNWFNLSDGRVKKNIKQNVPGLAFINKLQPITYNLDLDAADKIIDPPQLKDKDGKIIQPSQIESDARKAKEQIVYTGFIAQDVEKSAKELNYDFSGVDKPDNANTLYGLSYGDFVVPLVKAVQELSTQNDSLKQIVNSLQSQINELRSMIVSNLPSSNAQQSTSTLAASLQQNIPNPFSNTTTINYALPQKYSSAKIIITDKRGNALKQIDLSNNKGSVSVDASTLSSGAYQYSLYVDGRLTDSRQMAITK